MFNGINQKKRGTKIMNPYDDDLELVCDRCDVKISKTEKAYAYKFETICEECEDNND